MKPELTYPVTPGFENGLFRRMCLSERFEMWNVYNSRLLGKTF